MKSLKAVLVLGSLAVVLGAWACSSGSDSKAAPEPVHTITLREGWHIASSESVPASGDTVSTPGFDSTGWTPTTVPSTVVAALFHAGEIEDPYFGDNLERIDAEPFRGPWWYRTEFTIEEPLTPAAGLRFEGVNYSADVWLNGRRIAAREDLAGSFRMWELDVGGQLAAGENALAVLVYPPEPGDPTLGFVDWNPTAPDRNMGLWREVELRRTGIVSVDQIFVRTDLDLDTLDSAALTITARVRNHSEREIRTSLRGTITDGIEIEQEVSLAPQEERVVEFSPKTDASLAIQAPRLWWPNLMGEPELYELRLAADVDGATSDSQVVSFGIRDVADYLTPEGYRGYAVNGKKILIRGGGWVDDMLLADSDQKVEDQIKYVQHMNLNTIRLEGFWGSSRRLYELADRHGLLIMVGWSCQWEWEEYFGAPVDDFGGIDSPEEMSLVSRSLRDQVLWLRNHPSVLVWALASDMLPRPELEQKYYDELAEVDPTRPTLASCATGVSEVSGPSGVKMNGPYDWVSPNYWYEDEERGGAYGFNTETGPGPQPPPIESIRRMMPEEHWWPIDDMWNFHSGRHNFNTIDRYKTALDERYGKTETLEDFARLAQVANYEGMRAMFEAFSIRRPRTTGIIQWMLNSAWPELYWQLYDHYLVPNGAFYGARDAARPINVAYDYADRGIVVVNDTAEPIESAVVRTRIYDLESRLLHSEEQALVLVAETIRRLSTVPAISTDGGAYFLDARLVGGDGAELAKSLYWLSTKDDVLDWETSEWFVTPMKSYADLTGLAEMPTVALDVEHRFEPSDEGQEVRVTVSNPSDRLAFFVEFKILGAETGRRAAPVLWSDNYVSLTPGETLQVRGTIPTHALGGEEPEFHYSGINVGTE